MRKCHLFLRWIGWLYVLMVFLWLSLRLLFRDRLWWVELINPMAPFVFLPLPILLVAGLWQRQCRLLLGLSIPTVGWLLMYGSLFLPSFPVWLRSNEPPIKAMSFNVSMGNTNYLPIARIIQAENPDIVGLQEIVPEVAKLLVQELAANYPYNTLIETEQEPPEVVGILSHYPIVSKMIFPLPGIRYGINIQTQEEYVIPGPRLSVQTTLLVNGKPIQVAVADLVHNPTLRVPPSQWASVATEHYRQKANEIEIIQRQLTQTGKPFLFLCDCNFADTSSAHAKLTQFAKDSFREMGWGLGHTGVYIRGIPTQRIDYVWYSPEFIATEAKVGQDPGSSDHLPVVAKLKLVS